MGQLQFFELPVVDDQGLPQVFSCPVGANSYDFTLYANLDVPENDPPETVYDLAPAAPAAKSVSPPGYLVLKVVGPGPAGPQVVLLRKLVVEPGLVHHGGPLAFKVVQARIARGNLNGFGHYGTRIVIGVAQRWV